MNIFDQPRLAIDLSMLYAGLDGVTTCKLDHLPSKAEVANEIEVWIKAIASAKQEGCTDFYLFPGVFQGAN